MPGLATWMPDARQYQSKHYDVIFGLCERSGTSLRSTAVLPFALLYAGLVQAAIECTGASSARVYSSREYPFSNPSSRAPAQRSLPAERERSD